MTLEPQSPVGFAGNCTNGETIETSAQVAGGSDQGVNTSGSPTELLNLFAGYQLCARAEGKSPETVALIRTAINLLIDYLQSVGHVADVRGITPEILRQFICHCQQRRAFARHRFAKVRDRPLSPHAVNTYLRAISAFFTWLVVEGIIENSPFDRVKVPKPPWKLMPIFTDEQIRSFFRVIKVNSMVGFRDFTMFEMFLDSGLRLSELCHLKVADVDLENRTIKVFGKGARERLLPFGLRVQRSMWRYMNSYRPALNKRGSNLVFLSDYGLPLTKNRVQTRLINYCRKAGISGVRCSPHTLRHTFATKYLRNGGDVYTLQSILGHSSLEMTRRYVNLAANDIKLAHQRYSPVDNMELKIPHSSGRFRNEQKS